jgi:CHAD domain-containing protein
MRSTRETELKLSAPEELGPVEDLGQPLESRVFTSSYYDTQDRALARLGITLRRRLENGKNLWQLKLPGRGFRREVELPGGPARPPRPLRDSLVALVNGQELELAAKLKTRRSRVQVRDGSDVAEIVIDSVEVMDNGRVDSTFGEIEVELVEGRRKLLKRVARVLRKRGAAAGDGRPKVFRALGYTPPTPVETGSESPSRTHLASYLQHQRAEILAHDPGVRLDSEPEDVHRMRVAVRRARSVLASSRPILAGGVTEPLRDELKWLGRALGPVRDLDVLLARLQKDLDALPADDRFVAERLLQLLRTDRELARAQLLEALESDRYVALLEQLGEVAENPPGKGDRPLQALVAKAYEKLRDDVESLPEPPGNADLHRIRVRAKRARYAAELAEPAVGKKAARFVRRAKELQDVIGEHQDAVVAAGRVQEALGASRGGRVAFAGGRLVERAAARRREARAVWPKAWGKLERSGERAWR